VRLERELPRRALIQLRDLLADHPGDAPVSFSVRLETGTDVEIAAEPRLRVEYSTELAAAIEGVVGRGAVERLGL
jgi:hypothetical protein